MDKYGSSIQAIVRTGGVDYITIDSLQQYSSMAIVVLYEYTSKYI